MYKEAGSTHSKVNGHILFGKRASTLVFIVHTLRLASKTRKRCFIRLSIHYFDTRFTIYILNGSKIFTTSKFKL